MLSRESLSFAVVVCGACIGAWVLLVQPQHKVLHALEAEIRSYESPEETDEAAIQDMARRTSQLRRRLIEVEQASALGRDSSGLYNVLVDKARSHNVHVRSLKPGAREEVSQLVSKRRVHISVEGTYEQIASFIDGVNDMPQYTRPNSMTLLPRHGDGHKYIVHANLGWDVMSFELPDELVAVQGVGHVQP